VQATTDLTINNLIDSNGGKIISTRSYRGHDRNTEKRYNSMRINDIIETCFTPEVYNREVAEGFEITDEGDGKIKISVTMRTADWSATWKQLMAIGINEERSGYKVTRAFCIRKYFFLQVRVDA
jgi:hypothetical protein